VKGEANVKWIRGRPGERKGQVVLCGKDKTSGGTTGRGGRGVGEKKKQYR